MTIGIVGLGIIGGSMAKSIKAKTDNRVLGIDLNDDTMNMARMSGAIDDVLTDEALGACDLVMVAVPPVAVMKWAEAKAKYMKGVLLVDLCGVKRVICEKLTALAKENDFSYIGGHPMAGKEVSGFANASADLYKGASMILTPDENSDIVMLEKLKAFYYSIGFGTITYSTPEEHDLIIAYTSQLAHIASSAYVKSPTAQRQMGFSAGSYRDMTRVARLDPQLWTELFMENADYLTGELHTLIDNLTEYLNAIEARDAEKMTELLARGRELKLKAGGE